MAGMKNWDRLPNGDIQTAPVAGFEVTHFPLNVLCRFEILLESGAMIGLQMHFPAHRIEELAELMKAAAHRALSMPSGGPVQ